MDEKLLSLLPFVQETLSKLYKHESESLGYDPVHAHCIVDASEYMQARAIRVEPGSVPVIRVSASWLWSHIIEQRTGLVVRALRKASKIAHTKLRWTLGNEKPATAAEWIAKERAWRIVNPDAFTMPLSSFKIRYSVTVTDVASGASVVRENIRAKDLHDAERDAAHELTAIVYTDSATAGALDMLAALNALTVDAPIVAITVDECEDGHSREAIEYLSLSPEAEKVTQ